MSRARASVRDGVLTYRDGELDQVLIVGSTAWERWLQQPDVTTFRVEDGVAPFTARRQAQRGRWYWYAYRRQAGRLHKLYLGRPSDVTINRLDVAGTRFAAADAATAPGQDRARSMRGPGPTVRDINLPSQLTSFLGRQAESTELRSILTTARLVTLTGAGGVGKTRLALHLAAGIRQETATAVWMVELAPLTDPTLVPQAVAQAVGIHEEPGQPLLATLTAGLGIDPVLLVLDNCEHLVETCANVAAHLLEACPDLRLLATSREPLGIPGEVAWRVPSLRLPEPGARPDQQ
ncbi:MAG: ATP-binding protein, partial [Dehalococcoidia bacterium]